MKWYEFLGISVCRKCGSFSTNHESLYPVSCQKTELRLHCRFREGTLSQYYSLTHLVVKPLSLSFLLLSKRSYKNNFLNSISRLHPGRKKAARLTSNALAGLIARFEFSWIFTHTFPDYHKSTDLAWYIGYKTYRDDRLWSQVLKS